MQQRKSIHPFTEDILGVDTWKNSQLTFCWTCFRRILWTSFWRFLQHSIICWWGHIMCRAEKCQLRLHDSWLLKFLFQKGCRGRGLFYSTSVAEKDLQKTPRVVSWTEFVELMLSPDFGSHLEFEFFNFRSLTTKKFSRGLKSNICVHIYPTDRLTPTAYRDTVFFLMTTSVPYDHIRAI